MDDLIQSELFLSSIFSSSDFYLMSGVGQKLLRLHAYIFIHTPKVWHMSEKESCLVNT